MTAAAPVAGPPLPDMPPALLAQLHAALVAIPGQRFAVIDGVRDPGLRARLDDQRLAARPLYLENGRDIDIWAGPILVNINERGALDRFVAGVAIGRGAVFWGWPGDMAALHRHLRSINMAQIPAQSADEAAEDALPGEAEGEWRVLFRHYDPDALAPVLPVLTPDQRARFLGDADAILFAAEDYGGVVALARPADLPRDPGGLIQLDPAQMDAVAANRRAASRVRIARFLREGLPEETAMLAPAALLAAVALYERQARSLGLTTERDIARFAFLEMTLGNILFADADVRASFFDGRRVGTASEHLAALYDGMIDELEHGV